MNGWQTPFFAQSEPGPEEVSMAMKQRGIRIIASGIPPVDPLEILSYASSPNDLLVAAEFPRLSSLVVSIRVLLLGPGKLVMMLE